jgi:hypothetical protein
MPGVVTGSYSGYTNVEFAIRPPIYNDRKCEAKGLFGMNSRFDY